MTTSEKMMRVKQMMNDSAKLIMRYEKNRDMSQCNANIQYLMRKYGGQDDISGLLWWVAVEIQTIHDLMESEKALQKAEFLELKRSESGVKAESKKA